MKSVLTALVSLVALAAFAQGPPSLSYRVLQVHGKLVRLDESRKTRLSPGDLAQSGERLRTGWLSRAELEAAAARTRFALGPSTTVRLAAGVPGALLEVERGRLRAIFDALTGTPPAARVVTTPSAVLAVRGTEYGVSVDRAGDTTVVVFAGHVAVTAQGGTQGAVTVAPGQGVTVRHGMDPGAVFEHHMTRREWDRGNMPSPMHGMDGSDIGHGGMGGTGGGMGGHMGGHGG